MNFDDIKKKGEDHLNEHKDEYIEKGKEFAKDQLGGDKKDKKKMIKNKRLFFNPFTDRACCFQF